MCKLEKKTSKGCSFEFKKTQQYLTTIMRVKNSKKNQKKSSNMEHSSECPLCLEPLEMDDAQFFPCKCGYQICRFCWHRIRTNENGLCPQCRKLYTEDPATFKPLTLEELQKHKSLKKAKESQKKQKVLESRKQLANMRVLQQNLVFVVGLPQGLDSDLERKRKIFQPFEEVGPILKRSLNDKTSYIGSQGPSACAYLVYQKSEDAVKAIKQFSNLRIEGGRALKVSLGTTKYCCNFLKNTPCQNKDCMYLHELANEEACFTKEEIHAGKHLEYEAKLIDKIINSSVNSKSHPGHLETKKDDMQDVDSSSLETFESSIFDDNKMSPNSIDSWKSTDIMQNSLLLSPNTLEKDFCNIKLTDAKESQVSPPQESKSRVTSEEQISHLNPLISRMNIPQAEAPPTSPFRSRSCCNSYMLPFLPSSQSASPLSPPPASALWSSPNHTQSAHLSPHLYYSFPSTNKGSTRTLPDRLSLTSNEVAQQFALNSSAKKQTRVPNGVPADSSDDLEFDPCEVALEGLRDLVKDKKNSIVEQENFARFLVNSFSAEKQSRPKNGFNLELSRKDFSTGHVPQINGFSPIHRVQKPICDISNRTFPSTVQPVYQNHINGNFPTSRIPLRNTNPFAGVSHWPTHPLQNQLPAEYMPTPNLNFSQPQFQPVEQRSSAPGTPLDHQARMQMLRMQDMFLRPSLPVVTKPNYTQF